ncbi:unnamed protein product [Effrenium voratum]|nr:unnamed protein product [Effrenium voratum]
MPCLFIVALLGSQCLVSASLVETASLMQSRLRGSKTAETSISSTEVLFEDSASDLPPEPKGKTVPNFARFSDDDESCTTQGLSPGVCALSSLARPTLASHRLRKVAGDCDEKESQERLERALVAEIEAGLAGNHSAFNAQRLQVLQKELQPLYATLPHEVPLADIEGGLGLSSARYLLHQYFLRTHSWYVRGLNPAGDGRQPPEHKEALRSRVAGHLLEVLERKVGGQGLNLQTLAVFVATLEHLLHGDERQRLKQSWAVHDLDLQDVTDAVGLQSVLEVFMAHFVYSSQKADSGYALTLAKGREEVSFVARVYDGWRSVHEAIREGVKKQIAAAGADLGFSSAAAVADEVLESFRTVSGSICRDMVSSLAQMPGGAEGAVPLAEMRKKDGETTDYLRAANALDESNAQKPVVLVANYMLGPSNCDGTTSFYDLCCPDACAGHRAELERAVAEKRSMEDVERLVLQRGGRFASELRGLLEDGQALHGREVSMWLHQAFPLQCPRPAVSGFLGESSAVPDAKAEFQATAQVGSLFEW